MSDERYTTELEGILKTLASANDRENFVKEQLRQLDEETMQLLAMLEYKPGDVQISVKMRYETEENIYLDVIVQTKSIAFHNKIIRLEVRPQLADIDSESIQTTTYSHTLLFSTNSNIDACGDFKYTSSFSVIINDVIDEIVPYIIEISSLFDLFHPDKFLPIAPSCNQPPVHDPVDSVVVYLGSKTIPLHEVIYATRRLQKHSSQFNQESHRNQADIIHEMHFPIPSYSSNPAASVACVDLLIAAQNAHATLPTDTIATIKKSSSKYSSKKQSTLKVNHKRVETTTGLSESKASVDIMSIHSSVASILPAMHAQTCQQLLDAIDNDLAEINRVVERLDADGDNDEYDIMGGDANRFALPRDMQQVYARAVVLEQSLENAEATQDDKMKEHDDDEDAVRAISEVYSFFQEIREKGM